MYAYTWDPETGGLLLNTFSIRHSNEPRPVYYQELDLLGFDRFWKYQKDDSRPYMWAEAHKYIYKGRIVALLKGGSLFTAPSISVIEEPEPDGGELQQVDVEKMIFKNEAILDSLVKDTIKKIYNTYLDFKNRVQIFHVSFSGGKDSEVTFDLVQRALPHNEFLVIFGDTGMEFSDTYKAIEIAKKRCEKEGIKFYTARSHFKPLDSWKLFGPPSSAIRWCCSVHKTTPQLLLLRDILGKNDFTEMAFVGIRRDESEQRSNYDYTSFGTKHKGQFSCNPILNWNSAEVYLYIFANKLYFNEAYKKGLSRAGCLVCPKAAQKSDYINRACYSEAQPYIDAIAEMNASENGNKERLKSYLENTGWKARKNGRDLTIAKKDYDEADDQHNLIITFKDKNGVWKIWMHTIGAFIETNEVNKYKVDFQQKEYSFIVEPLNNDYLQAILSLDLYKNEIEFIKRFRRTFRKSHYCVGCKVCEANCKFGNLTFDKDGVLAISENCTHCGQCFDIDTGCLMYKSLWVSKGKGTMKQKSLDCYATHAPKIDWFNQFLKLGNQFNNKNSLGNNEIPAFKRFLRDASIIVNDADTKLGTFLRREGVNSEIVWALILTNLSYSPQVGWYVTTFGFGEQISQKYIAGLLSNINGVSNSAIKTIPNSLKRISLLPICDVGFGKVVNATKTEGFFLCRTPWISPDPKVILYSLYRFAESCGGYYQFTFSRLYDESVDSDGVSPARIFGTDKEDLKKILNGLSINFKEYINVTFTLDLDNITLKEDKTSEDVLDLF